MSLVNDADVRGVPFKPPGSTSFSFNLGQSDTWHVHCMFKDPSEVGGLGRLWAGFRRVDTVLMWSWG